MACYLLGFYVVALGRRGLTPLFGGACFIFYFLKKQYFSSVEEKGIHFFSFILSLSLSLSLS